MSKDTTEGIKLTDAQISAAKDAFKAFDKKHENKIKVGDLEAAMKRLGHTIKPDWLEKVEHMIDSGGTGYTLFDEFCCVVQKKMQDDEDEKELRDMFRILDKEKKGEVNTNELRWILKNLGDDLTEADIDDMIADVDTDGSGWVDYNEFCKLMTSD